MKQFSWRCEFVTSGGDFENGAAVFVFLEGDSRGLGERFAAFEELCKTAAVGMFYFQLLLRNSPLLNYRYI